MRINVHKDWSEGQAELTLTECVVEQFKCEKEKPCVCASDKQIANQEASDCRRNIDKLSNVEKTFMSMRKVTKIIP